MRSDSSWFSSTILRDGVRQRSLEAVRVRAADAPLSEDRVDEESFPCARRQGQLESSRRPSEGHEEVERERRTAGDRVDADDRVDGLELVADVLWVPALVDVKRNAAAARTDPLVSKDAQARADTARGAKLTHLLATSWNCGALCTAVKPSRKVAKAGVSRSYSSYADAQSVSPPPLAGISVRVRIAMSDGIGSNVMSECQPREAICEPCPRRRLLRASERRTACQGLQRARDREGEKTHNSVALIGEISLSSRSISVGWMCSRPSPPVSWPSLRASVLSSESVSCSL